MCVKYGAIPCTGSRNRSKWNGIHKCQVGMGLPLGRLPKIEYNLCMHVSIPSVTECNGFNVEKCHFNAIHWSRIQNQPVWENCRCAAAFLLAQNDSGKMYSKSQFGQVRWSHFNALGRSDCQQRGLDQFWTMPTLLVSSLTLSHSRNDCRAHFMCVCPFVCLPVCLEVCLGAWLCAWPCAWPCAWCGAWCRRD